MEQKTCPECGNYFTPRNIRQVYDCQECKRRAIGREQRKRKRERDIARAAMERLKGPREEIIGISSLEELSADELLHYGKISREAQVKHIKKEGK